MATGAFFGTLRCALGASAVLGIACACGGAVRSGGDGNGGGSGGAGGAISAGGVTTTTGGAASAGGTSAAGGSTAAGGSGATGTTLRVSDFDQRCEDISDCFVIHDGEQCACDECPDAAINLRDADRWVTATTGMSCPRLDCDPARCKPMAYACGNNTCVVIIPPTIAADGMDRRCHEDADCAIIPTGQLCNSCDSCGSEAAVSNAGFAQWAAGVDHFACASFGLDCPCNLPAPQHSAVCELPPGSDTGSCRLGGTLN